MKEFNIAVMHGDGIGVEIVNASLEVLDKIGEKYNVKFNTKNALLGGAAIDATGVPLPEETIKTCKESDAVILGSVGGPKWDSLPGEKRPEKALLGIREALGLYANLRPAKVYDALKDACPLKDSIVNEGVDLLVVRELTGGIYFGERGRVKKDVDSAYDTESYDVNEIKRIAHVAFKSARQRRGKVTLVDSGDGYAYFALSSIQSADWNIVNANRLAPVAGEVAFNVEDKVEFGKGEAAFKTSALGEYFINVDYDAMTVQVSSESVGVESIEADENVAPVYYNLQGVEVAYPQNGLYIVKRGNKVTKQLIK